MCPFMIFSGYMVSSGIAGSHGSVFLVFFKEMGFPESSVG